jgi:alcohol dehydrogenase (cytochrome c)
MPLIAGLGRRRVHLILLLVLVLIAPVLLIPQIRWRAHVLVMHLTGQIPGIELGELIGYMLPSSDQSVARLRETRNPYAVIRNLHTSTADIEAGARLFQNTCASCHAPDASGTPAAPSLVGRELKHGDSDWAMYRTVKYGVSGTAMPPHALAPRELWQIIGFVNSIDATKASASTVARVSARIDVTATELSSTREPGADWLTFSGSLGSTRHSSLRQIDTENVNRLSVRWIQGVEARPLEIKVSPLVRNGVMFLSGPDGQVMALDAVTGKYIWQFARKPPPGSAGGEFGVTTNRGVALLNNSVYVGTGDAKLICLSALTGKVEWEVTVADDPTVYFVSSAPLAYGDLIVTGVGTKQGGRGVIVAFDAKTGAERWRFNTIPRPGERGNETWGGADSWRDGGAPTWMTGSYDPELDLLFWGVGNPKPDYDKSLRPGDNLYTNSIVALQGTTGKLVWYFQFTPGDDHDWDSNQVPILAELDSPQGPQKRVLWANRNGFYYVLDRATGKFLNGVPYVRQNWTAGLDENGRPRPPTDARNSTGLLIYPGGIGGTNWWPPSYDPELRMMFVPALEQGMVFFPSAKSWPTGSNKAFYTKIRAVQAATGEVAWEYKNAPRVDNNHIAGVTTTDSGLLFGGDQTTAFALDARTGTVLWSFETGGLINAAPITYLAGGEQQVLIAAGRNLLAFALPRDGQEPGAQITAGTR